MTTQQTTAAAEAFWRQALEGCGTSTPLPAALRATERTTAQGRQSLSIRLPSQTVSQLPAGLPSVVLAAWAAVLGRFGNQDDVLFGFRVSGDAPLAPLRLQVYPDCSIESCLSSVARLVEGISEHGVPPPDRIRDWAGLPDQSPLFETAVVLDSAPPERLPLILRVETVADELELAAHYDAARFAEGAVSNVLQSLADLLGSMARVGRDRRFGDLSFVGTGTGINCCAGTIPALRIRARSVSTNFSKNRCCVPRPPLR